MGLADAAVGRGWRAYADARRRLTSAGSERPALRSFSVPPRSSSWLVDSAYEFDDYRIAHPPAAEAVTVVCATQRPAMLAAVVDNIRRQQGVAVELVLVTNADDFNHVELERARQSVGRCLIVERPSTDTLGSCLNVGLAMSSNRFVAKMDDDDHYGAHFLVDALRAHGYAGAAVVGKHTYYTDIAPSGDRYLRFPGNEFRYSGTLAGGTLVIDRERVGDLRFEDRSIGEDRAFLRACHRRGLSTFSADRFGFVQHRGDDNTWQVPTDEFLVGAIEVDAAAPEHHADARRPD